MNIISEIQIIPVKPINGLVAFCSFVLFESVYCGSVAIFTCTNGTYRLVYPTKKIGYRDMNIFHPITKELGDYIKIEVNKKVNEVMKNDRYSSPYNS